MQDLVDATRQLLAEHDGPLLASKELCDWYSEPSHTPPPQPPFPEIAKLVAETTPNLKVVDAPALISPIAILTHAVPADQRRMLDNLAEALSAKVGKAVVIDRHLEIVLASPELKLVIVSDTTLKALPKLGQKYRPPLGDALPKLDETALFILADPSHYLINPEMKRGLWNGLLDAFSRLR